ncbi:MAG: TlpA family protein disulfide reductase [Candidatus Cyclobacteriaceae bacterium M2_1C_046]
MRSLLLIFIFSTTSTFAQVVIKGKIHNYDGKSEISYYPTLDGIYSPRYLTVKPKPNGSFKIEFENEGFGTMDLIYPGLIYRFFYDSDSEIYLEFDQEKIKGKDRFTSRKSATRLLEGDHKSVNNFYNNSIRTAQISAGSYNGLYTILFASLEEPENALYVMDSLIQKEVDQINALENNIQNEKSYTDESKEIKAFLINEVKAFYTSAFLIGMSRKKYDQARLFEEDPSASYSIYNEQWINLLKQLINVSQKEIKAAPNSKDYNGYVRYLFLKVENEEYKNYETNPEGMSLDERINFMLFESDSVLSIDENSLFSLRLYEFSKYLTGQLFYSPALIDAVYEFKRRYPESAHIENLQPYIEKLENYVIESSKEYNKAQVIETNYTTFSDLIEEFKGQYILLDIWATWCHPCVEDFKHKDTIYEYMRDKNIITLYVSIDPPKWEERWRNSIKYNQLDGYHVRPNREFITDMWDVIGGYRGSIPRYVLINNEGKIFKASASRPVKDNQLISELEEMINGE